MTQGLDEMKQEAGEVNSNDSHGRRGILWWIGRHEPTLLLLIALVAMAGWGFVELADEVLEGETRALDQAILLAMRSSDDLNDPIGPRWFEEMMRDFTALGGVGVLTFITLSFAGFLALQRKFHAAILLLFAVGGGTLLSFLLKGGFDRPRPDLVPHESYVVTSSFPSGHSMMSAVTYLTLGALLAWAQPRRQIKAYLLILSIALTIVVGISRVYLGVHWPTDVLAGWAAGAVWALFCWIVARWLQQHGKIQSSSKA